MAVGVTIVIITSGIDISAQASGLSCCSNIP
jgi:hypothetical protein